MSDPVRTFFEGDVMLLNWSDTAKGGRNVVFLLDAEGTEHPFRSVKIRSGGKSKSASFGQQFKMVLVAIDENGEPMELAAGERTAGNMNAETQHTQAEPAQLPPKITPTDTPLQEKARKHSYTRSQVAFNKVRDDVFGGWLLAQIKPHLTPIFESNHEYADCALKHLLGITSKSELDTDPQAAARWDAMLATYDNLHHIR